MVLRSDTNKVIFLAGSHTWLNNVDGGEAPDISSVPKFNWTGYLGFLSATGHTLVKYWAWEQSWLNLLSNVTDFRFGPYTPWKRTGPGNAEDGAPKWNLDSLDQRYFDRVKTRIDTLAGRGVYAVVMLFDGWSVANAKGAFAGQNPFKGHPFNSANNIQGVGFTDANGDNTQRLPAGGGSATILGYQVAYVRKMIDVLNNADNIMWEICNEGNGSSQDWQYAIIDTIRNYESRKPKQHLINMSVEYPGGSDGELFASAAHNQTASPTTDYSGRTDNDTSRVIITDSDHICGECKDGDWVYRSFCNGVGSILYMDPWDGRDYPHIASGYDSSASSWVSSRKAMGQVVRVAQMANLIDMRPAPGMASTGSCLQGNSKWIVYQPSGGAFTVNLSSTTDSLSVQWVNTGTGAFVAGPNIKGGNSAKSMTPPFGGSALLLIRSIGGATFVEGSLNPVPSRMVLSSYPNPFNGSTRITFSLPSAGRAELAIYDVNGALVRTLSNDYRIAGEHAVEWDARGRDGKYVASGVYLVRLKTDVGELSYKLMLVR
jgi:hypothetical protein